jgi:hypothetical protein
MEYSIIRQCPLNGDRNLFIRKMSLRGGEDADPIPAKPHTLHVVAVGTICGAVLILNEMNLVRAL